LSAAAANQSKKSAVAAKGGGLRPVSSVTQATQAPTNQDAILVKFSISKNNSCVLFYHFQSFSIITKLIVI